MRSLLNLPLSVLSAALPSVHPPRPTGRTTSCALIVPYTAGSMGDTVAVIDRESRSQLGQPFIVDNRPGAGGNVGTHAVEQDHPTATRFYSRLPITWSSINFSTKIWASIR